MPVATRTSHRKPWSGALRLLAAVAIFYGLVCIGMVAGQRRLLYFPNAALVDASTSGLPNVETVALETPDGERLVAWWIPPRDPTRPVYLYLHGNGANLDARVDRFAQLIADGSGLYALSWRGYGGSTGTPTEQGLKIDARAAYADLVTRVAPSRVLVFGESLGSTLAVMLASEVTVGALLLDSSFASALGIAQQSYPWLPVRLLLRDTFRADLAAPRVTVPVLQVHCVEDAVTPIDAAVALSALFVRAEPLERIEGRCHVPSIREYAARRQAFVERAFPRS